MMIPITRKEKYINEIVGGGNTAPETPQTREEFFFAEILGEVVAPSPITRAEKYLAKIANKYSGELPEPVTRIERFIARAAGMDVTIPTPITREEIFWDNYSAVQKFEGVPPLTFKSNGKALKNYRIYGNTVDGESVGDRTANLFANLWKKGYIRADNGREEQIDGFICSGFFPVEYGQTYSISRNINVGYDNVRGYRDDGSFIGAGTDICDVSNPFPSAATNIGTFTVTNENVAFIRFNDSANDLGMKYMIVEGTYTEQTMPDYEPYGYRVPVTVNSNTTNIYLDEQLVKSGDDADYIDYATQKRYNADGTSQSVELPTLQTVEGTNTLSVGTTVQPSKVMVKIGEASAYKVRYYVDDTMAMVETVSDGKNAQGFTPTKASTAQYDYTFAGWTKTQGSTTVDADALTGVTADRNVYAVFTATARSYTVTFMNVSTLMDTQTVTYGGTAVYGGTTPTKAETSEYTYTFAGWNTNSSASTADADALTNVTADRTVYAIFTAVSKGYTVYFYNGETLLETVTGVPSGGTATYTGATPTSSQTGYIFSGWSPSNTNITADTSCYAQFKEDEMYESITDTWPQIIANIGNGTYSTRYQVGDTKKIDLGTEGEVIMTIVGIDTDDLADNSGKAPITWISKQLLKTDHRMNPSKQSGTSGTGTLGGWEACEMRSYLINTIKPLMPSEVRNALKTVKKYSKIYNTSGTAVNNVVSNDDIWIPSVYEMNFTGYETSGVTYSTAFPDNASRIKHKVGGSAALWWLRSANLAGSFRGVYGDGSNSHNSSVNPHGVAVGFCT